MNCYLSNKNKMHHKIVVVVLGKGTFRWKASGKIYDGDWKDDYRDGFGTLSVKMKNGTYRKLYVGGWAMGRKQVNFTELSSSAYSLEGFGG